jgi:hypothetical protein
MVKNPENLEQELEGIAGPKQLTMLPQEVPWCHFSPLESPEAHTAVMIEGFLVHGLNQAQCSYESA